MRFARVLVLAAVFAVPGPVCLGQEDLARALARLAPVVGEADLYPREGKEPIHLIARRHGLSASAVYNANLGDLLAGDELLLVPRAYMPPLPRAEGIVVNLAERNLYLYQNGRPAARLPVAIGRPGWETPTGDYTIINKAKNPTWFPPKWAIEEEPVPPGPDNPLGDRWMGLSAPGYGIHATNAPASIGRYVSHGCLRMYPEHAQALYDQVRVGTPVKIVYQRLVLGFDRLTRSVCLSYYPDPYELRTVTVEDVRKRLKAFGLDRLPQDRTIAAALERPRGVPIPIIGSRVGVSVNGRPLSLALSPVPRGDDWLVPAEPLAQALRAKLDVGPGASYVAITRGRERLLLSPGDCFAIVRGKMVELPCAPEVAAGHPMIPVRGTALALGASVGWDEATDTVLVWDDYRPAREGFSPGF